jgi:hypothetical protein
MCVCECVPIIFKLLVHLFKLEIMSIAMAEEIKREKKCRESARVIIINYR